MLPTKESEALGVKELMNKIQAQMEQEQRNGLLETNGRRKRKPRAATAPVTYPLRWIIVILSSEGTAARVRPCSSLPFYPIQPGQEDKYRPQSNVFPFL